MSQSFNFLRIELANHQDYIVRTAAITFSAVAVIAGLLTSNEDADRTLVGAGVGSLLIASLIYQNAVSRKVFLLAGFLATQEKSKDEQMYETVLIELRSRHPLTVGFWMETRAIACAYAVLVSVFTYMFFSSPLAFILHVIAFVLCVSLWWVPRINYAMKWEPLIQKWKLEREETDPDACPPV